MYRVTRTTIRGQYANDLCFTTWLAAQAGSVLFIKVVDDLHIGATKAELLNPALSTSPDDRRLYLWNQLADVTTPKCPNSAPDLVSYNGANGWNTQAEAQAVIDYQLGQTNAAAAQANAANAAAVDPAKIAADAAADLAKDAGKAADAAASGILSSPLTWILGFGIAGVLAVRLLK